MPPIAFEQRNLVLDVFKVSGHFSDRCNTHHDASPNNAKMRYKISSKATYPLIRGL